MVRHVRRPSAKPKRKQKWFVPFTLALQQIGTCKHASISSQAGPRQYPLSTCSAGSTQPRQGRAQGGTGGHRGLQRAAGDLRYIIALVKAPPCLQTYGRASRPALSPESHQTPARQLRTWQSPPTLLVAAKLRHTKGAEPKPNSAASPVSVQSISDLVKSIQ